MWAWRLAWLLHSWDTLPTKLPSGPHAHTGPFPGQLPRLLSRFLYYRLGGRWHFSRHFQLLTIMLFYSHGYRRFSFIKSTQLIIRWYTPRRSARQQRKQRQVTSVDVSSYAFSFLIPYYSLLLFSIGQSRKSQPFSNFICKLYQEKRAATVKYFSASHYRYRTESMSIDIGFLFEVALAAREMIFQDCQSSISEMRFRACYSDDDVLRELIKCRASRLLSLFTLFIAIWWRSL